MYLSLVKNHVKFLEKKYTSKDNKVNNLWENELWSAVYYIALFTFSNFLHTKNTQSTLQKNIFKGITLCFMCFFSYATRSQNYDRDYNNKQSQSIYILRWRTLYISYFWKMLIRANLEIKKANKATTLTYKT